MQMEILKTYRVSHNQVLNL